MDAALDAFLSALTPAPRVDEARALVALCHRVSGFAPHLAGAGMVGFGRYAYRYPSGHGAEAAVIAFAPRRAEIVLYPNCALDAAQPLLDRLGRHRRGQGCLYLKRLSDADPSVIEALFSRGMAEIAARWTLLDR